MYHSSSRQKREYRAKIEELEKEVAELKKGKDLKRAKH
jgi:hypothetical protein